MRLGYELTIEQKQQLSMTPELIQAIKILQLNNMDLFDFVNKELMENPILEEDNNKEEVSDQLVELNIRDHIAEDDYDDMKTRQWESSSDQEDYSLEKFTTEERTLVDFLMEQLNLSDLEGEKKDICRYIIEAIDDNGYLTLTTEELCQAFQRTPEEIEEIIDYVHQMEPAGVGARNLAECLEIQLATRGQLTPEMSYIIHEMLRDVADNKISKMAKALGIKNSDVQKYIDVIRTLEPKPGRQFAGRGERTQYVIPDIIVEKEGDDYVVRGNDASVPKLMVSSYYKQLSGQAKEDKDLDAYLTGRFNSAMWLIKSIEQRKQTIFHVATAIVHYQRDFFDKGDRYIKTLTLKQIAEELGVHESTVSRAINGKYMQSPRGVYELRYFFSSGVSVTGEDNGLSANSVKFMIRDIIHEENPKKPYSDQDMVAILKEKGIDISRRTVAKYREGMGILSSSKRRRF